MYVEYDSNNSGGSWWLKDEDWKALEAAGWVIHWYSLEYLYTDGGKHVLDERGLPKFVPVGQGNSKYKIGIGEPDENGEYRWLGALAKSAYKPDCASIREAADEWERITGQCATDAGCPCCGQPHTFTLYDGNDYIESGPHTSYEAGW